MSNPEFRVSQRLSFNTQLCTIRYIGPVQGTSGTWLGVEWDNPSLGKHPGRHNEIEYFKCLSSSPTAGSFIRPTRPFDQPRSFLEALRDKYVASDEIDDGQKKQIYFNGKLAEEIGFDKVARQQAALDELRVVVLDSQRIAGLQVDASKKLRVGRDWDYMLEEIKTTCGNIVELDLSRNLLENLADVAGICSALENLRRLVLSGNRFYSGPVRSNAGLKELQYAFRKIEDFSIDGTLMEWNSVASFLWHFSSLKTLSLASNELKTPLSTLPTVNLTSLTLSFNPLHSLVAIAPLSSLPHLNTLILASCSIGILPILPEPFPALENLDLSSNDLSALTELSTLSTSFPNLTSLRCSNNPFYSNLPVEEAHMLTLARISTISMLNYSKITAKEREDGELWYLSRIRGEIFNSRLGREQITALHPLWDQLSKKYNQEEDFSLAFAKSNTDQPVEKLINPNSLETRLLAITAHFPFSSTNTKAEQTLQLTLPKTISIPRLKSIIGRQVNLLPMKFRLIYETGDLDPVAQNLGNPGRVGEGWKFIDSDSEDDEDSNVKGDDGVKWVKREIDLGDSPRPIGFWVEGRTARVRIEAVGDV